MPISQCRKGFKTDSSTNFGVGGSSATNLGLTFLAQRLRHYGCLLFSSGRWMRKKRGIG
jgi:hypothetical protein